MRFGLLLHRFGWPDGPGATGAALRRVAVAAEQAGVASLWVNDHLFQIPMFGAVDDPMLEAYTTLGYLASATERVELGTLTTGNTYRHPGLLLKIVTTLDVLSGGRAWLGVGPAWYEREQRGLGIPVLSWPERFARLEELLQLAHRLRAGDARPFHGAQYRLEEPLFRPGPLRHIPILVGGTHERRLLPLVARYADACSFAEDGGTDLLRLKLRLLRRCCAEVGRDYAGITRTTYGHLALSRAEVGPATERYLRLAAEGIDVAVVSPPEPAGRAWIDLLAEVMAAVASSPAPLPEPVPDRRLAAPPVIDGPPTEDAAAGPVS